MVGDFFLGFFAVDLREEGGASLTPGVGAGMNDNQVRCVVTRTKA